MVNPLRSNTRNSSRASPCLHKREIDSFERFPSTGSAGLSTASPSSRRRRRRSSWNTPTCPSSSIPKTRSVFHTVSANPIFHATRPISCIPEHRVIISSRGRLFRDNFRSRPPEHFGGLVRILREYNARLDQRHTA